MVDPELQNRVFNGLMLRWLAFMEKTFPGEPCFTNLVRLMTERSGDSPTSPMLYFFNNNVHLQEMIRACDLDYFDSRPDEMSEALMGTLNCALPFDMKEKVQALPIEEQTKLWHFMNELLTIGLRVHPDYKMEGLPDSPFDREKYPSKLFMTY